ncbi:hypothetical protein AXF42_Ash011517 [Apostasia shenzhenica]|uniref:Uncharacterized protein n=1 Tax=Apostasia shenzhenica TaxID=1088818 RepID=A0A2I0BAU4_9ASPA|nr:hypothetical protein AXF42_Ash011517 [Apostasia shenzhenica]
MNSDLLTRAPPRNLLLFSDSILQVVHPKNGSFKCCKERRLCCQDGELVEEEDPSPLARPAIPVTDFQEDRVGLATWLLEESQGFPPRSRASEANFPNLRRTLVEESLQEDNSQHRRICLAP